MNAILRDAIADADLKYHKGEFDSCLEVYIEAVGALDDTPLAASETLKNELWRIEGQIDPADPKTSISILRATFSSILFEDTETVTTPSAPVERLDQLLRRTIEKGVPLLDSGAHKECYEFYAASVKHACRQETIVNSKVGLALRKALDEASSVAEAGQYADSAWILRRCFNELLESHERGSSSPSKSMNFFPNTDSPSASSSTSSTTPVSDTTSDTGYWQDEMVENETDFEIASCMAHYFQILKSTVKSGTRTDVASGVAFPHSFQGSDAVDVLVVLGLTKDRATAAMKCSMLLAGAFLVSLTTTTTDSSLREGRLYRYGTDDELSDALRNLVATAPHVEGSPEAQLVIALQITLDVLPSTARDHAGFAINTSHLKLDTENLTAEEEMGVKLAKKAHKVEEIFPECVVVDKDTVDKLVKWKICRTRREALALMENLCDVGLAYPVSRDHGIKDDNKHLSYRFISTSDLHKALKAFAVQPNPLVGIHLTRRAAAATLYQKRVRHLSVKDVLSSFFETKEMEGWDLLDLRNWCNNMKRWGFGRREDQDDDMVEYLASLVKTVDDPSTWFESLSDKKKQEWTSPWGILAQIAIFDQVPRSAFRGTPEAFKWDDLAIKASKLAIERGYFASAYKSTLNQFLVLLPLEHSEDWKDQQVGVKLILQLVGKVTLNDDGLSDNDIVKRMEFSKRLSTAFLEHAKVIKKFKRYPHRNKQLGRTTTLEERIWLASDLVPRWAKSQNSENVKQNVVELPVMEIPLKMLTQKSQKQYFFWLFVRIFAPTGMKRKKDLRRLPYLDCGNVTTATSAG